MFQEKTGGYGSPRRVGRVHSEAEAVEFRVAEEVPEDLEVPEGAEVAEGKVPETPGRRIGHVVR